MLEKANRNPCLQQWCSSFWPSGPGEWCWVSPQNESAGLGPRTGPTHLDPALPKFCLLLPGLGPVYPDATLHCLDQGPCTQIQPHSTQIGACECPGLASSHPDQGKHTWILPCPTWILPCTALLCALRLGSALLWPYTPI